MGVGLVVRGYLVFVHREMIVTALIASYTVHYVVSGIVHGATVMEYVWRVVGSSPLRWFGLPQIVYNRCYEVFVS